MNWRALRIPGDKPCSCSPDCDAYILALEASEQRLRQALEDIYLNPDRPPAVIAETARVALDDRGESE